MKNITTLTAILLFAPLYVLAEPQLKPDDTRYNEVRQIEGVLTGTLLAIYPVTISKDEDKHSQIGGALGGYIARESVKGESTGKEVLGTLAGVAIGSKIGREINEHRNSVSGVQLIVDIPGLGVKSIIQQNTSAHDFSVGGVVYIIGYTGRYHNIYSRENNVRVLPKTP